MHNNGESDFLKLYRFLIIAMLAVIGWFARDSFNELKSADGYAKVELVKIYKGQESLRRSIEGAVIAEYVSRHYVVVVIKGERILLKRVYPGNVNEPLSKTDANNNLQEMIDK